MEIQQLVLNRLAASVGTQIVQSVGCLQESFTGTLQRCVESLEKNCHDLEGNLSASDAVKQIIHAAYNIDLKTPTTFSVVHTFMDKLRKLLGSLSAPWSSTGQFQCTLQWQLQVVTNMTDSLSSSKLAKTICLQVKFKLLERYSLIHERNTFSFKNMFDLLTKLFNPRSVVWKISSLIS